MPIRTRRTRRQTEGRFRLHKPQWIDPHPNVPGTEPEKRVFALLRSLGIYFVYQGQIAEFKRGGGVLHTMAPPNYKPDFVLPEYKLIIDPFGEFHHSQPEAVERDTQKVAAYSAAGYAYYHPWTPGGGDWRWDQYHDERKKHQVGTSRRTKYKVVSQRGVVSHTVYKDKAGRIVKKVPNYGIIKRSVPAGVVKTPIYVTLYEGVNAERNSYRNLDRNMHSGMLTTFEMLMSIPELKAGPRYKLTDPEDVRAKQSPGWRMGEYLVVGADGKLRSPGDTSVAAANARRRVFKAPTLKTRR